MSESQSQRAGLSLRSPSWPGGHSPAGLPVASGLVWLLVALVALSTVSTKLAGATLLVLLVWALWMRWRQPDRSAPDGLVRLWVWLACGVLLLRGAATVLWQDSWGSRHFEIRLALSALVVYLLISRVTLSQRQKRWLVHAMAVACCAALGLTWLHGRDTPTNPIPWAAGVSFLVCVLAAQAAQGLGRTRDRLFWSLGTLAGLGAVFLSQSRGSFGLLPWLLVVLTVVVASAGRHRVRAAATGMALLLSLAVAAVAQPRLYQEPLARVQEAQRELSGLVLAVNQGTVNPQVLDTSVGARAYMYLKGWQAIQESAWMGRGEPQRKAWVTALGQDSGSEVILSLNHLHNDALSIWMEHGALGIASYTLSVLGLWWLAWRSRLRSIGLGLGFAGLAWTHASTGLTNMNTIHNYYGVMLSLAVVLLFLLDSADPRGQAVD